ncbi:MAG TPA: hypothetical protein VK003_17885 [Oceanobacillus sp.]|nr:hypothetical protein [Oceanobacillus sp.]
MSSIMAREFLELLDTQGEVRDQLYISAPANADELRAFASQKGYFFEIEDLRAAAEAFPNRALVDQLNTILEA